MGVVRARYALRRTSLTDSPKLTEIAPLMHSGSNLFFTTVRAAKADEGLKSQPMMSDKPEPRLGGAACSNREALRGHGAIRRVAEAHVSRGARQPARRKAALACFGMSSACSIGKLESCTRPIKMKPAAALEKLQVLKTIYVE